MLRQQRGEDGCLEVAIIGIKAQANDPHCQKPSVNIHDTRVRQKRDGQLGTARMVVLLHKRRVTCFGCQGPFTEADQVCGTYRRTTMRVRRMLGKQGCKLAVARVRRTIRSGHAWCRNGSTDGQRRSWRDPTDRGRKAESSPRLVCSAVMTVPGAKGLSLTRSSVIGKRSVLEVSSGRQQEEVARLLERLDHPDAVEAVRMDRSKSFRAAVERCLPKAQMVVDHVPVIQQVMKAFRKVVSSWAHKKERKSLLEGKQHRFLRAKEDLTEEQAQERTAIGNPLPVLETAWP